MRAEDYLNHLPIALVQHISVSRAIKWHAPHGLEQWSSLEWCGAMCGEAGEAANIAKKLRRHDLEISQGVNAQTTLYTPMARHELEKKYARELADVFLYLVLCAARENIDLEKAIIETFNAKSIEAGFPERL